MSRSGGSPLRLAVMTPMLGTFKVIKRQSNVSGAGGVGGQSLLSLLSWLARSNLRD